MIFKNIDFHNVSSLTEDTDGSYIMHRFPISVEERLEGGALQNTVTTGVELRFKIKSGSVKIKLKNAAPQNTAARIYQYRGSVLDAWQTYTYTISGGEESEITVEPHASPELLMKVTEAANYPFSPSVVRIVLNWSSIRFVDVIGDIEPPSPSDVPKKTYLAYGSSITNGSHAYAVPSCFVSRVASHFGMDALNRGLAGNARLESAVADEIALMGERGEWDIATLCLGINISGMPPEQFRKKVGYMLSTVAGANPDKHIFAISPIYSRDDMVGKTNLAVFREVIESEVRSIGAKRLHYVNGLSLLSDASGLSGDFVHPTPDGADKIAQNLIKIISDVIAK